MLIVISIVISTIVSIPFISNSLHINPLYQPVISTPFILTPSYQLLHMNCFISTSSCCWNTVAVEAQSSIACSVPSDTIWSRLRAAWNILWLLMMSIFYGVKMSLGGNCHCHCKYQSWLTYHNMPELLHSAIRNFLSRMQWGYWRYRNHCVKQIFIPKCFSLFTRIRSVEASVLYGWQSIRKHSRRCIRGHDSLELAHCPNSMSPFGSPYERSAIFDSKGYMLLARNFHLKTPHTEVYSFS